jgi:hypothetical protein
MSSESIKTGRIQKLSKNEQRLKTPNGTLVKGRRFGVQGNSLDISRWQNCNERRIDDD